MLQCCLDFRGRFFMKNLQNYLQAGTEKIRNVCAILNLEVTLTLEVFSGCQHIFDSEQSTKQKFRAALGCIALQQ